MRYMVRRMVVCLPTTSWNTITLPLLQKLPTFVLILFEYVWARILIYYSINLQETFDLLKIWKRNHWLSSDSIQIGDYNSRVLWVCPMSKVCINFLCVLQVFSTQVEKEYDDRYKITTVKYPPSQIICDAMPLWYCCSIYPVIQNHNKRKSVL